MRRRVRVVCVPFRPRPVIQISVPSMPSVGVVLFWPAVRLACRRTLGLPAAVRAAHLPTKAPLVSCWRCRSAGRPSLPADGRAPGLRRLQDSAECEGSAFDGFTLRTSSANWPTGQNGQIGQNEGDKSLSYPLARWPVDPLARWPVGPLAFLTVPRETRPGLRVPHRCKRSSTRSRSDARRLSGSPRCRYESTARARLRRAATVS